MQQSVPASDLTQEDRLRALDGQVQALRAQMTYPAMGRRRKNLLKSGWLQVGVSSVDDRQSASYSTPPPPADATLQQMLQWRESYKRWLRGASDSSLEQMDAEKQAEHYVEAMVEGVDNPSLYLLASAPCTFDIFSILHAGDGAAWSSLSWWRRMRLVKKSFRHAIPTLVMALLVFVLTFLTIVIPVSVLVNFMTRDIPFLRFKIEVDQHSEDSRTRHRGFLKIVSFFLMFLLVFTSLTFLDDVGVFAFYILGDLQLQVVKEEGDRFRWVEDDQETKTTSSLRRIFKSARKMVANVALFGNDSTWKSILYLGIFSKFVSVITVFQLTYLVFRLDFKAISMILNSVALKFLLESDRMLVAALKRTSSPIMRRYFATAVSQLRDEAEVTVATPGLVVAMVQPRMLPFCTLLHESLDYKAQQRCTNCFPKTAARVFGANNQSEPEDAVEWEKLAQRRKCCQAELFRRVVTRVVVFFGYGLVLFQILGTFICVDCNAPISVD